MPMHLASALQLAGYRHVIGTLWPVMDTVAARTAEWFYADLDQYGQDSRHIARSLSESEWAGLAGCGVAGAVIMTGPHG